MWRKLRSMSEWQFNKKVASTFVPHARQHIPNYDRIIKKTVNICKSLLDYNQPIIDVGCATGETLNMLSSAGFKNLHGVDNSASMLEHCLVDATLTCSEWLPKSNYNAIILNWTLHFIEHKIQYLKDCKKCLTPDGFMIISEKVSKDPFLIKHYHNYKRLHGVSEEEITHKQSSVENVMHICSSDWYKKQGEELGFSVDIIDADFCFITQLWRNK
jgi:tRNA (cmo5U34)-methyltransferase